MKQARTVAAGDLAEALDRLAQERALLLPLPAAKLPDYTTYEVTVRRWSTIRVNKRTYSVPSV